MIILDINYPDMSQHRIISIKADDCSIYSSIDKNNCEEGIKIGSIKKVQGGVQGVIRNKEKDEISLYYSSATSGGVILLARKEIPPICKEKHTIQETLYLDIKEFNKAVEQVNYMISFIEEAIIQYGNSTTSCIVIKINGFNIEWEIENCKIKVTEGEIFKSLAKYINELEDK